MGVQSMTKIATLCLVINNGKILLMRKKRGFGHGKIVAPGGHVENETLQEAATREVFEETGIMPINPEKYGEIYFYFGQEEEPDWIVHIFLAEKFEGVEKETAEGIPKWHDKDNIPYDDMWADDIHWVPLLLQCKKFTATFFFDKDVKNILKHEIKEGSVV